MSSTPNLSETKQRLLATYLRPERRGTSSATITRRHPDDLMYLSVSQERMWQCTQRNPGATCYNEPITVYRKGPLDPSTLEQSLTELVRRHEAWRTTFVSSGNQIVQAIHEHTTVALPMTDVSQLAEEKRELTALHFASEDACAPFDLEHGPLYRARLVRMSEDEYRLYVTAHHMILDGVTVFDIFYSELVALYCAFSTRTTPCLPHLPVQYADFAAWQRKFLKTDLVAHQMSFWRKQLGNHPDPVLLPTGYPRPQRRTFRGSISSFTFSKDLSDDIRRLGQSQNVRIFPILVAAFVILLYRYTSSEDITVGTVAPGGRKWPEVQRLMGLFQNRVALRIELSSNARVRELLAGAQDVISDALCHDDIPFEIVADQLAPNCDPGSNPFFTTMISLEPPVPNLGAGWDFSTMEAQPGGARLDLYIEIDDRPEGMLGRVQYNRDLFTTETIRHLTHDFEATLKAIVADPEQRLSDLGNLTLVEKHPDECVSH